MGRLVFHSFLVRILLQQEIAARRLYVPPQKKNMVVWVPMSPCPLRVNHFQKKKMQVQRLASAVHLLRAAPAEAAAALTYTFLIRS